MFPFRTEKKRYKGDLATVESQRNDLIPEEFPEGPYGAPILTQSLGKTTPWHSDQRASSAYGYENLELHEGMDRGYPGDRGVHDEDGEVENS